MRFDSPYDFGPAHRPTPRRWRIDLDFALEQEEGKDDAAQVEEWRAEYAPDCTATIVGTANGNPVVRLEAADSAALRAAVRVYQGVQEGDTGPNAEQVDWLMQEGLRVVPTPMP